MWRNTPGVVGLQRDAVSLAVVQHQPPVAGKVHVDDLEVRFLQADNVWADRPRRVGPLSAKA